MITYPPKRDPSELEIAYAAGFFEGEGTVGFYSAGSFVVILPQVDREILDRMVVWTGGHVVARTVQGGKFAIHKIELYGVLAHRFIDYIEPYLSERRMVQVTTARSREAVRRAA